MAILLKECEPYNFESYNSLKLSSQISEVFVVNLSLNQTLLTFLHYARQTCMTQLTLAVSLWGFIFL